MHKIRRPTGQDLLGAANVDVIADRAAAEFGGLDTVVLTMVPPAVVEDIFEATAAVHVHDTPPISRNRICAP